MGLFQRPGLGGWVFNAATTDWAAALWNLADNSIPDRVVSRVTLNVMRRLAKHSMSQGEDAQSGGEEPE